MSNLSQYSAVISSSPTGDGRPDDKTLTISTLYPNHASAARVHANLLHNGFRASAIVITPHPLQSEVIKGTSSKRSRAILREVMQGGAIGAALGVGVGAVGTLILMATSVASFIASPLLAPSALMVNLATVGFLLGGAFGAANKGMPYPAEVAKALDEGQVLLAIKTQGVYENFHANKIIQDSIAQDYQQAWAFDAHNPIA